MDTVKPTIQHTDAEVIVRLRKTSDLELKVYNPAFMQSLGFVDVSVSLVDEEGATLPMTGGGNNASSEITFPYSQFVYMLRGDTKNVEKADQEPFNPFAQFASFMKEKMSGVKNPFSSGNIRPPSPSSSSLPTVSSLATSPTVVKPVETTISTTTSPIYTKPIDTTVPSANAVSTIKPTVSEQPPPSSPFGVFSQTLNTVAESVQTKPEVEPVPEKTLFWKIVIPKVSNPERTMDAEFWGDLNEEWFNDVKHLARMEKKWGVFIQGEFFTVLGRKCKFGSVVKWENQNSLIDYLEHTVFLENTVVDKYYRAYMISNPTELEESGSSAE